MTIQEFFHKYPCISPAEVAARAGLSHDSIRRYAIGMLPKKKGLKARRIKAIEKAIREIGKELAQVRLK